MDHSAPGAVDGSSQLTRLLVLLGLTGFAISQPLLSVLGSSPTLFTFHHVRGMTLVWLAVAIAFVPPIAIWLVERAASAIDGRLGRWVFLISVGFLVALVGIQVAKAAGLERAWVVAAVALAAAIGLCVAYVRFRPVATWLSFTAPLPFIAVLLFVFTSPTADLLHVPTATPVDAATNPADLPPVVFVMLDELPTKSLLDDNGDIDRVRFPNLAAFADGATWYRNYTTMAPFTTSAVPSILSGTVPTVEAPLWTKHPDNLFTMLEPTHDLTSFESLTYLCGTEDCGDSDGSASGAAANEPHVGDLLRRTSDLWMDRIALTDDAMNLLDDFAEGLVKNPNRITKQDELTGIEAVRNRPERLDQFVQTFDSAGDRPGLYYLHLMLPHHPWRFYADGTVYDPGMVPNVPQLYPFTYDNDWGDWVGAVTEQRHLLQAEYADRLIGDIVGELRAEGLYDDAIVVITADHGASFEPDDPMRKVTEGNLDGVAYAPLLVKAPGQAEGVVDDSNLMAVDVVPTIADLVGVTVEWQVDGFPAGSAGIERRGERKEMYDFEGEFGAELDLRGIITFDRTSFPSAADRSIPPATPGRDELTDLYALIGLDGFLGGPIDDVLTGSGGEAEVVDLDRLRRPGADQPSPGLVAGRVHDATENALAIVAIDGSIVGGSPLYELDGNPGYFGVLLDSDALDRDNEVQVALFTRDGVVDLDLREP